MLYWIPTFSLVTDRRRDEHVLHKQIFLLFRKLRRNCTGNVRRADIKNTINTSTKTIDRKQLFLQNLQTVAEGKGIAKHSLGTLDRRVAAAAEMTVSPITEFQDVSYLTAVRIGGSHARTSVDKPKSLHATEQWGYGYR